MSQKPPGEDHRARRSRLGWGLAAGVFIVALLIVFLRRDTTPLLDAAQLRDAQARWSDARLTDYSIDLLKKIDRQSEERVSTRVEDSRAVEMRVNDVQMPVRDSYTVDGLFDMIEREQEMATASTNTPGQPVRATLKVRFDPATGTPIEFRRLAPQRSFFLTVEQIRDGDGETIFPPP